MYFCNLRPFYPFLFFPFIHSFNLFVHTSYVKRDASMQDWLRSTTKLITNLFPYNSFLSTLTRTSLKNFQKARLSYKSNKFYKSFRVVYNRSKYIFEQKLLYFLVHHFDEICIVNSNFQSYSILVQRTIFHLPSLRLIPTPITDRASRKIRIF